MMKMLAAGVVLAPVAALAGLYGDTPDEKHAWAVHDWNRPKPVKVSPAPYVRTGAPSDAIVLFDGTRESLDRNWCDNKGNPTKWKIGDEGDFYVAAGEGFGGIFTREHFGDCQLHIEFRHEADIKSLGGPQMRGNSGVFLMGPNFGHEIQVLESYWTSKEMEGREGYVDNYADGQAGSVYGENPPLVNPARKPGEWQTYDIIFHQPVWEGDKLVRPGSVTVLFNGVLVQDHWEMEGMTTHCRRRPLAPHAPKGPLHLQDHGCTVHFRNIWYRPLASRWDNTTHSSMSGKPEDVMKLRRETAEKLFAKIKNPAARDAATVMALAEVVSYANEGKYKEAFDRALETYRMKPGDNDEVKRVNRALSVLVRNRVVGEDALLPQAK